MKDYRIQVATATHMGDRPYQQDKVVVLQHLTARKCLLVVVADGMGGESGGAMASGQVVETATQLFRLFDLQRDHPQQLLRRIVEEAHSVIRMLNFSSEHNPHTTIAAFLVMPSGAGYWAHSGDSRIYHVQRGKMLHRTKDHSYVQSLVDKGILTPKQAIKHPQSNILLGCLGTQKPPPIAEYTMPKLLEQDDVLLACSDGLWGYVTDREIAKITTALPPRDAANQLIEMARTRGNGVGDNISVAILKARDPNSIQ